MKRIFLTAALIFGSAAASANVVFHQVATSPNELIQEVVVREVPDVAFVAPLWANDCSKMSRIHILENITWDQILAAGQKIWKVVEDNRPVVNVEQPVAHALPSGLACWADLENWNAPTTKRYQVEYRNGLGGSPVKFDFRLHFTSGGGKAGKGKYLANVTVMPAHLDVSWGYTFDAKAVVGQAVNRGTNASPVAGLEINVDWTVKTVLKESRSSVHMFVEGDGKFTVSK